MPLRGRLSTQVPPQWLSGSALELVDGRCQVQSSVALVDLAVRSFRGFLRNSRKYGIGSLRKTLTEGTLPQAQVSYADNWLYLCNQLANNVF